MASRKGHSYWDFAAAFRRKDFKPLYFIYGEETFLIDQLQRLLIQCALQEHEMDFNYDLVYGAEADSSAVLGMCRSYPIMAERRVVVVRNFELLKQSEPFAAYAEVPNPTTIVMLLCARKPELRRNPYKAIKSKAAWGEITRLRDRDMPGWISKRAKKSGRSIQPRAAAVLADYVGTSLRTAANEIDKLVTFVGDRTSITVDDVVRAGGRTRDVNVFKLQRAIGNGRLSEALRIGDRMLTAASNQRGEALRIVAFLTAYYTKLWKLQSCRHLSNKAMAASAGISPFFLQEYLHSLRRLSDDALRTAFSALLAADFELKGATKRSERLVMTLLIRQLAV